MFRGSNERSIYLRLNSSCSPHTRSVTGTLTRPVGRLRRAVGGQNTCRSYTRWSVWGVYERATTSGRFDGRLAPRIARTPPRRGRDRARRDGELGVVRNAGKVPKTASSRTDQRQRAAPHPGARITRSRTRPSPTDSPPRASPPQPEATPGRTRRCGASSTDSHRRSPDMAHIRTRTTTQQHRNGRSVTHRAVSSPRKTSCSPMPRKPGWRVART